MLSSEMSYQRKTERPMLKTSAQKLETEMKDF